MTRLRSLLVCVTVLALAIPVFASPQSGQLARIVTVYAKQQFKPAYFNLTEIKTHSDRTYHPGEGKP